MPGHWSTTFAVTAQGVADLADDNPFEECDGADKRGETCASMGFGTGILKCYSNCTYNYSACDFSTCLLPPCEPL